MYKKGSVPLLDEHIRLGSEMRWFDLYVGPWKSLPDNGWCQYFDCWPFGAQEKILNEAEA